MSRAADWWRPHILVRLPRALPRPALLFIALGHGVPNISQSLVRRSGDAPHTRRAGPECMFWSSAAGQEYQFNRPGRLAADGNRANLLPFCAESSSAIGVWVLYCSHARPQIPLESGDSWQGLGRKVSEEYQVGYKYDVFLSYPHEYVRSWVLDIFLEPFHWYLMQALGRSPSIFIDAAEINPGDSLEARIAQGIAISRCMVGIWCTSYFQSEWCLKECMAMLDRERVEGFRTASNPSGLVLPVKVADGDHFPELVQGIFYLDCSRHFRPGGAFKNSPRYIEFQDMLVEWTPKVAAAISKAPQWKESWLSQTVTEAPLVQVSQFPIPSMI